MCSELEAFMPGKFQFTADRDYADYLYLRTELATLAGKKFQSKRNHVNKFKRTYNYEYIPSLPTASQECHGPGSRMDVRPTIATSMKERATNVAHWSTPSTILKNWD